MPLQLAQRNPLGSSGTGMNKIGYGFGLGKINPTIEKGTQGKFPWLREDGTGTDKEIDDFLDDEGTTVAVDLYHILASEGPRGPHDNGHDLVNQTTISMLQVTMIQLVARKLIDPCGRVEEYPEECFCPGS